MAAPQRAPPRLPPRPPQGAPQRRAQPELRVVEGPARRRFARSTWAVLGVVGVFVVLFGLAAFHTVLVQGQQRLDDVERRVAEEQARYERQRLEAARLEAPGRIVDTAVNELGMVSPQDTTYLTPSGALDAQIGARVASPAGAPADQDPSGAERATGPAGSWMTVKPFLDDAP